MRDVQGQAGRLWRPLWYAPFAPPGAAQNVSQHALRRPGYIRLELPVFHVGYVKHLVGILQCVCKSCARVMVQEDERRHFLRRLRSPRTEVSALRRRC